MCSWLLLFEIALIVCFSFTKTVFYCKIKKLKITHKIYTNFLQVTSFFFFERKKQQKEHKFNDGYLREARNQAQKRQKSSLLVTSRLSSSWKKIIKKKREGNGRRLKYKQRQELEIKTVYTKIAEDREGQETETEAAAAEEEEGEAIKFLTTIWSIVLKEKDKEYSFCLQRLEQDREQKTSWKKKGKKSV